MCFTHKPALPAIFLLLLAAGCSHQLSEETLNALSDDGSGNSGDPALEALYSTADNNSAEKPSEGEKTRIRILLEDIDKLALEDRDSVANILAKGWKALIDNTGIKISLADYMETMKLQIRKLHKGNKIELKEEGWKIAAVGLEIRGETVESADGSIKVTSVPVWYGHR